MDPSARVGTGNVISFCAAISACEKGHAWPMALNLLELQGFRFAKHEKHQVPFPFTIVGVLFGEKDNILGRFCFRIEKVFCATQE